MADPSEPTSERISCPHADRCFGGPWIDRSLSAQLADVVRTACPSVATVAFGRREFGAVQLLGRPPKPCGARRSCRTGSRPGGP